MLKSNFQRIILFAIAVTLASLMPVFALPQREASKQPIHKEGLIKALKQLHRGDSQAEIVGQVRLRGVDFELTPAVETEMRGAGASSEMFEAIRANYRAPACLARSPTQGTGRGYAASLKGVVRLEMVEVPPGSFCMGDASGGEKPVHQVTIGQAFFMGKFEVTQAQWQSVMGANPSYFKDCGGNCPVEQVSWDDAQQFIQRLNQMKDGYAYRLPTEAEWEYACRAGTTGDYAGDLDALAWYYPNAGDARLRGEWNYDKLRANNNRTHAVGSKLPNAFGLFDMHGNVWEWCQDWYHATYYGAPTDGSAWLSGGNQIHRVLRGGYWNNSAIGLRSAERYGGRPADRSGLTEEYRDDKVSFGFRVVAVARTQ